jgi:hypothetical protein
VRNIAFAALVAGVVGCTEATPPPVVSVPPPPSPTASASVGQIGPPPPAPPAPPPIEGAPAPAKQAIDPNYLVDGGGLLLGVTSTEIWALLGAHYTVVIDRATGCATEGYAQPKSFEKLHSSGGAGIDAALKAPETLQGLRDMVGVGRRVGALGNRFMLDSVWSPDGRFIAFVAENRLYRSTDGGRSFAKVDDTPRSRLAMSADGKFLTYQEGREYFSVPVDGSRPPRPFTRGQTFLTEMRPGAQAFFWRSDSDMCADIFDLAAPQLTSSTCLPVPAVATGHWPSREWESISPNGNYGIVKWEEARKNLVGVPALTYVLALVEMPTKKIVKTVLDMRGEVDDGGNMVMSSMSEGGGDHTYYYPLKGDRRLLGNHSLMTWHDKTAIMSVYRRASLGARKCDLVKMVKTP